MTIHNARLRALYLCIGMALCLAAFGSQARADDGTATPPRAVPLARALPKTYLSYDSLLATAAAVANDQVSLYAQLQAVRAENDLAKTILASVADPRLRGGFVRIETNVTDEPARAALRAEVAATEATQAQLIASGAIA